VGDIVIEELLNDILVECKEKKSETTTEKVFIETILDTIHKFLYKRGQPVHTVAIGILRGKTFDMYYRGRLLDKYTELFGAMSYETTIAGRACELFKEKDQLYLNLNSQNQILEGFKLAGEELKKSGLEDEAEAIVDRARVTIDQGIGSFLLMPLSFCDEIIGIFTISSLKESSKSEFLGSDIEKVFMPVSQMLSLILYMEKISHDKAEEMGRLLISSIDGKDEYQATHSSNVRSMIDIFIDELSRDKELRERIESIGFKLTVDRIERLRLAALLHDMGKVFVPSAILRKYRLSKDELLVRKMHAYCTYNMLSQSKTLGDIADIASMHHARYYIPPERFEKSLVGYPFDLIGANHFAPENQIISLADTVNSIVRARPGRQGLSLSEALDIIDREQYKFHSGLKDVFLIIFRRVLENLKKEAYSPDQTEEYRQCLWLEDLKPLKKKVDEKWVDLHTFLEKIDYNNIGIVSVMHRKDAEFLLNQDKEFEEKPIQIKPVDNKYIVLSMIDIPKEEGFSWMNKLYEYLKSHSFKGKIAFAFVGKSGLSSEVQDIYKTLIAGLNEVKHEPVHFYLNPDMFKLS
jgi:HD-GYP domain-containing protein (c-di-GMP phosphodiesterase class II)